MKKIKKFLIGLFTVIIILFALYGLFWIDYHIWRDEHPNAKTYTYFIHARRD